LYGASNISSSFAGKVCTIESSKLAESLRIRLEVKQQDLINELAFISPLYDPDKYNIKTENICDVKSKF
jgi:hypothetical protein